MAGRRLAGAVLEDFLPPAVWLWTGGRLWREISRAQANVVGPAAIHLALGESQVAGSGPRSGGLLALVREPEQLKRLTIGKAHAGSRFPCRAPRSRDRRDAISLFMLSGRRCCRSQAKMPADVVFMRSAVMAPLQPRCPNSPNLASRQYIMEVAAWLSQA